VSDKIELNGSIIHRALPSADPKNDSFELTKHICFQKELFETLTNESNKITSEGMAGDLCYKVLQIL
jgi:hypothetical protein